MKSGGNVSLVAENTGSPPRWMYLITQVQFNEAINYCWENRVQLVTQGRQSTIYTQTE